MVRSSPAMVAELGFPGGAWMRELASLLWNKVLQTSLSFAGVCSGAGVGSGSSPCTGVHRWPLSVVVLVLVFVFVGFAFGHFCVAGAAVCGDWARGGEGLLQFDGSDG